MKLSILNAEPKNYSRKARSILKSIGDLVEKEVSQKELEDIIKDFDVLIVRLKLRVNEDVLSKAKRLKYIVTATTGLDHIDVDLADKLNIKVLSLRGETEFLRTIPPTAEHTWALMLSLLRKIPWAFHDVKMGSWDRDKFIGNTLAGKYLGIVGLGRIGNMIARYGLSFGMKVGAYDVSRDVEFEGIEQFETIEELLSWAEIVTIHLPLNEDTKGLLNKDRLSLLPRGAWLINTSRGAIVDEKALLELLKRGHLSGAAIDVIENESTEIKSHKSLLLEYARTHSNLLITPHIGGATKEAMERTEIFMAKKLKRAVLDSIQ